MEQNHTVRLPQRPSSLRDSEFPGSRASFVTAAPGALHNTKFVWVWGKEVQAIRVEATRVLRGAEPGYRNGPHSVWGCTSNKSENENPKPDFSLLMVSTCQWQEKAPDRPRNQFPNLMDCSCLVE